MAEDPEAKGSAPNETGGPNQGVVPQYLRDVCKFGQRFTFGVRTVIPEESREILDVYAAMLGRQLEGFERRYGALLGELDPGARSNADDLLADFGAPDLIEGALRVASDQRERRPSFWESFSQIWEKIKAPFLNLLECLGIRIPNWVRCLLDLVDNLIRLIIGLFSPRGATRLFELELEQVRLRQAMGLHHA